MTRHVIGGLFVFTFSILPGQTLPPDMWHEGKVVTDSGDTIRGLLKYDLQDMLQVNHQNKLESFTPTKVVQFEILDQFYKRKRVFYSLPYASESDYKTPVFFEVLCQGKITILTKEIISITTQSTGHIYYAPRKRRVLENKYFLFKENGNIESLPAKESAWRDLVNSKAIEVNEFVKVHNLNFDEKYDLKRIIDYFNSFY